VRWVSLPGRNELCALWPPNLGGWIVQSVMKPLTGVRDLRSIRPGSGELLPAVQMDVIPPQVEGARRTLWAGLLVFRWVFFAWFAANAIFSQLSFRYGPLAWIALAATGAWTLWLSLPPENQERPIAPWIDLLIAVGLIISSGLVVPQGKVIGELFFAVSYPASAALLWGAARGPGGGIAAGAVLSVALVVSRPINGIPLQDLSRGQVFGLVNGMVSYVAAGAATGVFSLLFSRWAEHFRKLADSAFRASERAARLAARESMGRAIHDSVLQSLALIHKRARELGEDPTVPGPQVLELATMARDQELALRALIMREPEDPPTGASSLRDRMEVIVGSVKKVPVTLSAVGPIWLVAADVETIAAAVEQALDNVVRHSGATRAVVFADVEDPWVTVSVRDNGSGFVYDERDLQEAGKVGLLKSMKGRVADVGGRMRVKTAPGIGTEVEFRVPYRQPESSNGGGTGG
jgi:signal transduction histidine kinase